MKWILNIESRQQRDQGPMVQIEYVNKQKHQWIKIIVTDIVTDIFHGVHFYELLILDLEQSCYIMGNILCW